MYLCASDLYIAVLHYVHACAVARREREVVAAELRLRYDALKQRWKSVLELSCADDERTKLCSPSYLVTDETDGGTAPRGAEVAQPAAAVTVGDPDVFLKLQAQVRAVYTTVAPVFRDYLPLETTRL